jgi:hypothetical protein
VRAAAAAAVLTATSLAAGCGFRAPDLFVVDRSGSVPGAGLSLVVADNGLVHCNGGRPRRLPDPLLLAARRLARDLAAPAERHLRRPPRPGSVLSYRVRLSAGTVTFSDNSAALPPVLVRLQGFVRVTATQACGLPR